MINEYDQGDDIRLTATITNSAGSAVDPAATIILVVKPDGNYIGYGTNTGWTDQGVWAAATNTPALADGTGTGGHYYTASDAGSVDFGNGSIDFVANDRVYYNGVAWRRWHSPSATTLTKDATGIYYIDQFVGISGAWSYRAEGVTVRIGEEVIFIVSSTLF
jgi:hypothetical protein